MKYKIDNEEYTIVIIKILRISILTIPFCFKILESYFESNQNLSLFYKKSAKNNGSFKKSFYAWSKTPQFAYKCDFII